MGYDNLGLEYLGKSKEEIAEIEARKDRILQQVWKPIGSGINFIGDTQEAIDQFVMPQRRQTIDATSEFVGETTQSPLLQIGTSIGMEFLPDTTDVALGGAALTGVGTIPAGATYLGRKLTKIASKAPDYARLLNMAFDLRVPNPTKLPGLFNVGTGLGPDGSEIKKGVKRYLDGRKVPDFDVEAAKNLNISRVEMTQAGKPSKPKKSSVVKTKGKINPLDAGIDANVDKFSVILEYPDLKPTDAAKWKNKVIDFLNQANVHRNKQILDGNTARPLDGFEFIETVGRKKVNTKSRSLIGPDGRVWTVRGPSGTGKNAKGWRIKSREQLTSYRNTREFRDLTSSPEQALARRRLDQFRSNENKILKAKKAALQKKAPWDMTKQEADWLEWATHQEYYGEHIRRLSDANPYWRTPQYLKGTMKRGDVANYKVFSNQIEKSFKDSIESIIYGTKSSKHYGGYLSTTGNRVTLGMTNDLTSLTLEEILPSGRLKRIGEIPLSRAYEEGTDFKKLVAEYLGPPPTVLKFTYKPVGVKTLNRIEDLSTYVQDLIMNRSDKKEGLFFNKTEQRKIEKIKRMKGSGTIK